MATKIHITVEEHQEKPHAKVIRLVGEIDESNLGDVREHVAPLIIHPDAKALVFDMEGLSFMNSRVIGYFLSLCPEANETKTQLKFANANKDIYRLIDLVGLQNVISHYHTIEEAVADL